MEAAHRTAKLPAVDDWTGIADADAHLGRPVPLPAVPLPLARWVEVHPAGPNAVEVEWNLDDTRPGSRGRLALYVGPTPPEERPWDVEPHAVDLGGHAAEHRTLGLEEAEPPLRPAHELRWERDGLHLRLTAQGPWTLEELLAIGASVRAPLGRVRRRGHRRRHQGRRGRRRKRRRQGEGRAGQEGPRGRRGAQGVQEAHLARVHGDGRRRPARRRAVPALVPRREQARDHRRRARAPDDFTGWEVHDILRWLLLAAAVAPLILAYIVLARPQALVGARRDDRRRRRSPPSAWSPTTASSTARATRQGLISLK